MTAYTGKVEVGQNIRTSLTQAVAEELRVAPVAVKVVMGDTDLTPFDIGTFGSRHDARLCSQTAQSGRGGPRDAARSASAEAKVERGSLLFADGKVTHPATNRSLSYGELSKGQKMMKAIARRPSRRRDGWKVAGKSLRRRMAGRRGHRQASVHARHQAAGDASR